MAPLCPTLRERPIFYTSVSNCPSTKWRKPALSLISIGANRGADLQFVVPNIVSIDGETPPKNYLQSVVPWQLQSPIYPTIGLMMASTVQSMVLGGDPVHTNNETSALKARAFSLLSKHIQTTSGPLGEWIEELMGCILNLIVFEVCSYRPLSQV